jgi:YHS domain-containing protein
MFVDVELPVSVPAGLTIPVDAVIDSGRQQRVFVEKSKGVFEPRDVQLGWRFGDRVEITSGLNEGDRVVSAGTFLVDSESRLKSGHPTPKEQLEPKAPPRSNGRASTAVRAQVKDAACGMMIDAENAKSEGHTVSRGGVTYYFCSDKCKKKFVEQPDRYLAANPSGPHS